MADEEITRQWIMRLGKMVWYLAILDLQSGDREMRNKAMEWLEKEGIGWAEAFGIDVTSDQLREFLRNVKLWYQNSAYLWRWPEHYAILDRDEWLELKACNRSEKPQRLRGGKKQRERGELGESSGVP